MKTFIGWLLAVSCVASCWSADPPHVVVVVGASGAPEYQEQFRTWAQRWQDAGKKGQAEVITLGLEASDTPDREQLQQQLAAHVGKDAPLWLVLIGHGTFDGKTARFNLRGEDVSSADLAAWIKDLTAPLAVIDCSSCSGAFLSELSGKERIIITATRSGHEYNFARFGDFLSTALNDPKCDLDKDEQTSLLEAFLVASAKTQEFYASEARLATEHALLDDNGDRLGTPADWYVGLRPTKAAKDGAALDGGLARTFVLVPSEREEKLSPELRQKRDALERELAQLRSKKKDLDEVLYFPALEKILVEIARLSQTAATPPPMEEKPVAAP